MFLHRSLGTAMIVGTALAVSGCLNVNDSSTEPVGSDEEGIQNVIFEEMNEYADTDVRWYDEGSDIPNAPVTTHRWRRELLNFDRNVVIEIDRPDGEVPTAFVTMTGEATGLLHLWACEADDLVHYAKDFDDTGTRSMMFRRVRQADRPTDRHRGWKLIAISGVEIASAGTTRNINSVRIQTGDIDETITGVRDLTRLGDLLDLPMDVDVTVTVDTGDATDAVFLHRRHRERRTQLESNDDGTFSGVFHTGGRPGPRHIAIDVLSNGSIYDSEEAYDNRAWGIPMLVGTDIGTSDGGDGTGGGVS